MTSCIARDDYIYILRIVDKLVFEIVSHLNHIVVYELEAFVI